MASASETLSDAVASTVRTLAVIAGDVSDLPALPVQVHTPVSAKGLEFDVVVIVDPERIREGNPADLYVAMTRATQRLGLLHVGR